MTHDEPDDDVAGDLDAEGPGEHDAHLMDDEPERTVPCQRCGKPVSEHAERCPACGMHFAGEAWQFNKDGAEGPAGRWAWALAIVAVIMLVILIKRWFG